MLQITLQPAKVRKNNKVGMYIRVHREAADAIRRGAKHLGISQGKFVESASLLKIRDIKGLVGVRVEVLKDE
jgi:hypothetical protein